MVRTRGCIDKYCTLLDNCTEAQWVSIAVAHSCQCPSYRVFNIMIDFLPFSIGQVSSKAQYGEDKLPWC